ncbi:MAG: YibE/F family protein [Patescibacteria group bacterium]
MSTVGAVLFFALSASVPVSAQEFDVVAGAPLSYETRAVIERIVQDEIQDGARRVVFEARDKEGNVWMVDSAESYVEGIRYRLAQDRTVILQVVQLPDGERTAFLIDVVRVSSLMWIAALFALVVVAVGWWRGALALVGLGVTVAILLGWIVPRILGGADPLLSVILGSAVILCVNMFLTHGFRRATTVAFGSTLVGLALTVLFSKLFVVWSNLSGLGTEEAAFVQILGGQIQPAGLFLAGIVLGAVGVLDDVAVAQIETVFELRDTDKRLGRRALFSKAMRVGRHHIASVVNTLVLAYAGVALPLLLLFFINADLELWRLVNEELIAEEIVRTLAGTLGLVLLMPIATALAVWAPGHETDAPHT